VATALVLGIGNVLLRDDGAGVHAATQLKAAVGLKGDSVRVLDAGTLSFALLPDVQDSAALIVIDAAREGLEPGTVTVREDVAMDVFVRRSGRSVHEVGLADLLDMARLSGHLPLRRALIGIEPGVVEWGVECTPAVAAALPAAVARALGLLAHWRVSSPAVEVEHAT